MKRPMLRIEESGDQLYAGADEELFRRSYCDLLSEQKMRHGRRSARALGPLTEHDLVLITYGDQITEPGVAPLRSLANFLGDRVAGLFSFVHLLPFCPSTSDDGFAVSDYTAVEPRLGGWDDIDALAKRFGLMFDLVLNHCSPKNIAFKRFKRDVSGWGEAFLTTDPQADLSAVVRPRSSPLLTPFKTRRGIRHVWTTFSADQVDWNYRYPLVLTLMARLLYFYVNRGASIIRLDAIAYLWKEIGTSCINLPQTHAVVRILRAFLDEKAPGCFLLTETNVPHQQSMRYFGSGDEAHLVYQFALSPLVFHAFLRGDASHLRQWAASLEAPPPKCAYFNFLASHDGIGLRPVEGILPPAEIQALVDATLARGGLVSLKANSDGSQSPYELNISYFDALSDPSSGDPENAQVQRFLTAQAILLCMAGLPAIYVHSLFGSRNWTAGVAARGQNRAINRQMFQRQDLERELADDGSLRAQVFSGLRSLILARKAEPAFHPSGAQHVLASDPALFSLVRTSPDGASRVLCLHNVSGQPRTFKFDVASADAANADLSSAGLRPAPPLTDLLTGVVHDLSGPSPVHLTVPAYGVRWLRQR
jgi:glycosidase